MRQRAAKYIHIFFLKIVTMPPIGPIAGSLLTGLGTSVISHIGNLINWKRQNKYNLPVNQMARLEEAGLNPRLIYGASSGGAAGNASSIAPTESPRLGEYLDLKLRQGQVKQVDTQNLILEQELRSKKAEADRDESFNRFGMDTSQGQTVQVPVLNPETNQIEYQTVGTYSGVNNYQREAFEKHMTTIQRRYAATIKNILSKNYSPAYQAKLLEKVQADLALSVNRARSIYLGNQAAEGFNKALDAFGTDNDVGNMIIQALKFAIQQRKR
jgi:hypothetical protein